jgi:4-amino-4-deoxy-L-arabinose transferase-like glycosyltransferase
MQRFRLPSHASLIHAAILLAIALPYCINLGKSSIWDATEALYAETPREMIVTGDYISPQFNFQPRTEKPPLAYYVILISYKLFGINEFAVRFPGALAAIGVLLFSYGAARLLFGPRAAIICATICATTARIFILARRLPIDILLLFFLTGAMFFLVRGIQRKDRGSWAFAYLFFALGFLTKGPVAVVIPAGAIIIWMLWGRRSGISAYPYMGCAIFACVVLPWYVLVYWAQGWTYIAPFFLKENLGRFAANSFGPSRGPFYYFSVFATDFFPWSLLAPAALYRLWRIRKEDQPLKSLSFGLPLIWCILIFCLFSVSKNKQEYYIAPLYPAAAVILSGILDKSASQRNPGGIGIRERDPELSMPEAMSRAFSLRQLPRWRWRYSLIALIFIGLSLLMPYGLTIALILVGLSLFMPYGLIALILFGLSLLMPYIFSELMPDTAFVLLFAPSLILIAGVVLLAWNIMRGKFAQCFSALAVSLWAVFLIGTLFYIPALEEVRPIRSFCNIIKMQWHEHDEAGYFRTAAPSMVFYLQRPIFEESNHKRMMRRFQSNKRIFCILTEEDYSYFTDKGVKFIILDRHSPFAIRLGAMLDSGRISGKDLLLVCTQFPELPSSSEGRLRL